MWELICIYCGQAYSDAYKTTMSFGRSEWTYVLVFVCVWGALCMRGFAKRL